MRWAHWSHPNVSFIIIISFNRAPLTAFALFILLSPFSGTLRRKENSASHTHTQFNGLQQRKPDRNEKGRICIYICIYFSVQRWRWSGSHGINKLIFLWHRKCFRNCQPTAALMPFAFFASFGHCKLCLFFLCRHNLCIRIGSHGVWVRSVCQPVFFFAFSFKWRCEVNCVDCDLDRETCDGFW